jgi:hypothetical protein
MILLLWLSDMITLLLGIALMIGGFFLFFTGRNGSKKNSVSASGGSVAIGGSNRGQLTNINVGSPQRQHQGGHGITILAIVVEIIGIGVVIWHALHLAVSK